MSSKLDYLTPPGYSKPKKINEGAFGQVLKVVHERSGVEYAVKVLPVLKEGYKERVSREVEMLTRFAHPRIVRLHESIDMGGHHAIVMELGTRSLKDLINEYKARNELIPLPLTVMILSDICEGLLWMHTHSSGSTAHGDLKPENVLLRENNRAFLCDLGGSAPLSQQLAQTIAEMGTFEYNSPERAMDSKGTATPASDVWSLGVLAYRMVTGKLLFEGLTLPQLCHSLDHFSESDIPTTIPASVREVLLKMLEPNVALRATTTALFEGGLLERMLGPETALSKMKDIQLATRANEIKQLSSDAKVKEKTMKLEIEKEKLLDETKELERQLRLLQMSLQRTRNRNLELEKEDELEQHQHLIATHTSPIQLDPEDNILSNKHEWPALQFHKDTDGKDDQTSNFVISGNTITKTCDDKRQRFNTILFEEPISDGVVSVAITVLAVPKTNDSAEGLMFGLVDALSREIGFNDQLGDRLPSSLGFAPRKGRLHLCLPSTEQREKKLPYSARMGEGDRVVLEVDMDARPRTAVFIINGTVPLTFVSGLPPSIRFGLSMENDGVSVRFDGITRLKQATPLRRLNEIKWNPEDLRDSEDMYMNGMRSNVLTVQTQMPSHIFSDPIHSRVEENRITSIGLTTKEKDGRIKPTWSSFFLSDPISEGIVAVSFTCLSVMYSMFSKFFFSLIDGTTPIPETGQTLGDVENSIALSSTGIIRFLTPEGPKTITSSAKHQEVEPVVVEINMDSNPRTAQFFVGGKSANAVVVDLPESVRVGFSPNESGLIVRFDRITHLNRGSPFTDQMKVFEWPTAGPLEASKWGEYSDEKDEDNDLPSTDNPDEAIDKAADDGEDGKDTNEAVEHNSERMEKDKDEEESGGDSEDDTDEEKSHSESDSDGEDEGAEIENKKKQLPTMKLPELLFTNKTHFAIRNNVLTRTEKGTDKSGETKPSSVLLSEPITKGIVSVTFVVLTLAESSDEKGFVYFGLLDSSRAVPRLGRTLGENVKHSVGLSATKEQLNVFTLSSLTEDFSQHILTNHDRIVMEVNMDSSPRTVQFFVNGKAGKCYVSGIPESVRIGFSADAKGTSLEIACIIHSTQPTPITDKMKEIKWTDTKQSLNERHENRFRPIRREADGSMPALLSRNPEHFKIEGNVITRTTLGYDGLTSPFSTVMLDGVVGKAIKSVTVTILALPQSDDSCGVVMIGCIDGKAHIPKSPKGLGIGKDHSFALCSSDGMIHRSSWYSSSRTCHSPLQVGDQVVMKVNTKPEPDLTRFSVNGKTGNNHVSDFSKAQMIGFSLAGAGTSIRIDALTGLGNTSQTFIDITDNTTTNETFKLTLLCALTGIQYTINVHSQNTILQVKEGFVRLVGGSIEDISLMFEAEDLNNSTTLSEIDFRGDHTIIAFINESDDEITVTRNHEDQ
ncbi:putative serine/threonine protein kinase [Blattamonas nauphoetae]|uniref:non-specific serine/threonine protein kinase n=1 Tax=Blattamonas nauphoetae TaxID=2049346 RepID=A0ABQ9Y7X4_9EUKA|nr:putative serine/threonine protein kinase [Blattamonas nauphoetae]